MQSVLIRNLAPETVEALKRLANQHNRSLQGELQTILERAARLAPPLGEPELRLHTVITGRQGTWPRDEIYDDSGR